MSNLALSDYARNGQIFTASNQAGATVTLINTSTATGFILNNPWGSGKKLLLTNATFTYTTVPAAAAVVFLAMGIAPSQTAHTGITALTVYGADGSGAANNSVGKAYSASTTPNLPVYTRQIGYVPTTPAAVGALTWSPAFEGELALVPGTYVQISYITTAPVGITSMTWIEVKA